MKYRIDNHRRKGSALVMAILLLLTMMVMTFAFFHVVMSANRQLDAGLDDDRAFYLAEAALLESVQSLRGGGTGAIASEDAPVYFGGGVYWVERSVVSDDPDIDPATLTNPMRLTITAMAGKGRQALEVILRDDSEESPLFVATLNSKDTLTMNADTMVDSFKSSDGDYASQAVNTDDGNGYTYANLNGNVRSNNDVILNARATVLGDANPGPGGAITYGTDAYVHGSDLNSPEEFAFPPIEVPSFPSLGDYSASSATPTTLGAGQYAYDAFTIDNGATLTVEGPAEIVVQDFTGNKSGNLLIDATNGPVTFYVENSYTHIKDFEADAVPGSPMAVAFMVTANQDIVFPSATPIRGAYYLPDSNILFSSANECWGSFAANRIDMSNGMKFHFDEDLADYFKADTGDGEADYAILAWAETEVGEIEVDGEERNLRLDRRDPLTVLGVTKNDLPRPADAWTVAP